MALGGLALNFSGVARLRLELNGGYTLLLIELDGTRYQLFRSSFYDFSVKVARQLN